MASAFSLAGCPRSTSLWDFVAIAQLKIVDYREHDLVIHDLQGESVKQLQDAPRVVHTRDGQHVERREAVATQVR